MTNEIKKYFYAQNASEIISWFHKYAIWLAINIMTDKSGVILLKLKLWIDQLIKKIITNFK